MMGEDRTGCFSAPPNSPAANRAMPFSKLILSCALGTAVAWAGSLFAAAAASEEHVAVRNPLPPARTDAGRTEAEARRLIGQLGSDDYLRRREAETQLLALGAAAFDQLQQAQTDPDLEIATQAEYLLHQIAINHWVQAGDPAEVRELMTQYPQASAAMQLGIIGELASLDGAQGVAALCRIAHFELSPKVAKYAALAVLGKRAQHQELVERVVPTIARELSDSPREAAQWLRTYAEQLQAAGEISPQWLPLIDAEAARLAVDPDCGSPDMILRLLQFHIELCADRQHPAELFESLRRRIDYLAAQRGEHRDILAKTLIWTMKEQEWEALGRLETSYADQIKQDRLMLYLVAVARGEQGQPAAAEEIAERAHVSWSATTWTSGQALPM